MLNIDHASEAIRNHYERNGLNVLVGNPVPFIETYQQITGEPNPVNDFNNMMQKSKVLKKIFYGNVTCSIKMDSILGGDSHIHLQYFNTYALSHPIYSAWIDDNLLTFGNPVPIYFKTGGIFVQHIDMAGQGHVSFDGFLFGIEENTI